ncbi:head GIN domain-containing protein [Psychroflexus planctonicus]|uniref:DUF2807 domain-containing protein n=1 Tax=Psychroflexus planctonicus TaxID=1526575 RepID=A0ABQ1SFC4_9FLAO|nr:head GIN domain-containing protein [Psychroflexus planctonicus]GGE29872.1 DUF2807 domain-containing protein [Psychroflexus planctonicus]
MEGNKQVIEETRTLSGYTEIEISGNFEVELVQGIAGKINIMAESNMLEHIVTEVQKGSLRIEVAKKMNLKPNEQIKITVPFEELEEIVMSGSGNLHSKKPIEARKFEVKKSGSGNMYLSIDASRSLAITKSGSGNIEVDGKTKKLSLISSGSGDFKNEKFVADQVDIKLSGSGQIYLTCKDELSEKVSGSGNVKYKGNPSKKDIKTSGSGKVEKL